MAGLFLDDNIVARQGQMLLATDASCVSYAGKRYEHPEHSKGGIYLQHHEIDPRAS
jgi:hypothetical protein